MSREDQNAAEWTLTEAQARSRETAEQLAVRLRWLSIGVIPVIVFLSAAPVRSPGFETLLAVTVVYNWIVGRALESGRRATSMNIATAVIDSVLLTGLCWVSGGIDSALTTFFYLAMVSVCTRLPVVPALAIGVLYAAELTLLAWTDGSLGAGQLPVKICYVFLTAVFVSPLAQEARQRFAEVLIGHQAQRSLLHRLLRTGEDERRRIARELHDRGGGALFSLLHGLRRLRDVVHQRDLVAEADVDGLIRVTEATLHDLRTLLGDLRPSLLDDLGLAEALRELLSRERAISGMAVSFEVQTEALPESESALALYRVVQEAFTNIRRHAHANAAEVRLTQGDGGWILTVEDDGTGLNGHRTGLGLRTMRERVEALGGRLEIYSAPRGGTKIWAWVPENLSGEGNGDPSLPR